MRLSPEDLLALASDATDAFRLRLAQALRDQGDPRGELIAWKALAEQYPLVEPR